MARVSTDLLDEMVIAPASWLWLRVAVGRSIGLEDAVFIEWTFSPRGFFEDTLCISGEGYRIVVADGKAEAIVTPSSCDDERKMRDRLRSELDRWFRGVQLLTHVQYVLSRGELRLRVAGRVTTLAEITERLAIRDRIEAVVCERDGNVKSDSRQERIDAKRRWAELAAKSAARDARVDSLLRSYNKAVDDPTNELVYLYEIRDALSEEFGGARQARTALGIAEADWSQLGALANEPPLKQGRHRGKAEGPLREATWNELDEARRVARHLLESYMNYVCSRQS